MNENRKRGTSNNKILTAIAIASLFIGSSKIMAIETYSENSFGVTEQMQAQTIIGKTKCERHKKRNAIIRV